MNISDESANAAMDVIGAKLNNGFLDLFDGVKPVNANLPITTQNLLATLTFGATAFIDAIAGVIAANAIGPESDNKASGTATWARLRKSNHTSVVCDLTVGTSGADINLNSNIIQIHAQTTLDSLTLTLPE